MESQYAVIRYNFDKQKDSRTGMWYTTCKWCGKKCSMRVSGGYGMAMKHIKSCDKAKGSGDLCLRALLLNSENSSLRAY
ncbi:unnamed protein product [Cuscuta europaea]|uniref:Uncharacterized protein n=1 Tax=Cuscuta europaea TaxID=41803 RepID=A0A9P1EJC0_CUSEU|nr:unnamed protein product [Cuscuta europaea]